MGKATIISGGTNGLYDIQIDRSIERAENNVIIYAARIVDIEENQIPDAQDVVAIKQQKVNDESEIVDQFRVQQTTQDRIKLTSDYSTRKENAIKELSNAIKSAQFMILWYENEIIRLKTKYGIPLDYDPT